MKSTLICLVSLFSFIGFAQNPIEKKSFDYKNYPPGTVPLNDSVFIDVAPVDNLMYNEFLNSLKGFWSETIHDSISQLPNFGLSRPKRSENLSEDENSSIVLISNYMDTSPKYSKYPRTKVTKSEAELYCKWRTDMVRIYFGSLSKNAEERTNYPLNFHYRLPASNELQNAFEQSGYSKKPKIKYKEIPYLPYPTKGKKIIFLKDNLSEYTFDSIPFGTNWKNETTFDDSNDYIGFRCVCEILN